MLAFLFSGHTSLPLRGPCVGLSEGVVLSVLTLKISPFVVTDARDLIKFILGDDLGRFKSVCVDTLAVLRDTVRFTDMPLAKFTRKFIPVVDCGCKRNSGRHMGRYFHVILVAVFSFGLLLVLFVVLFPSAMTSTFADSRELVRAIH